jgi:hypothetical protein
MKPIDDLFTAIAREHLFIETLETRNRDSLDFHDVSVSTLKDALQAAYRAGLDAGAGSRNDAGQPGLPITIISVRGGCVESVEAAMPLRVILEDWDCEDRRTGKKPYRTDLSCTGLSSRRASQCLRHV